MELNEAAAASDSARKRFAKFERMRDQLRVASNDTARIALEKYPDWDDLSTVAKHLHELCKMMDTVLTEVQR